MKDNGNIENKTANESEGYKPVEGNKAPINGGYPLHTFEDVENLYSMYISSPTDKADIQRAYDFIREKHKNQYRKSGEPYYHHLVEVAYIIASLHAGPATIIAAFLHDVVEDTDVTVQEITKLFGEEVATIVDSLTKIQRLKLSKLNAEEFEAEDHRKIFIGMAKDIRVIIIKLADRLHNLRTLGALSEERQKAIANETMEVFVPIAHRLGLDKIKSEMQDLCLLYLEPDKYHEVKKLLSKKAKTMNKSLENIKKRIADMLFEKGIPFTIESRVKSIYSIYNKMYNLGHPFDEIYDILALRIITDDTMRCYEILGLIHQIYKPVPGRFKDYIAMPKPNMYQSLHTTVVSGDGNFYEFQIRTKEMDAIAEEGVAAHWAYKEGVYNSKKEQKEIENQLHWFRDFVSIADNTKDEKAQEVVDSLTKDIFDANIYVFTPKGRVLELPNGATPVDFAYRVHTKVGDSCVGALVNGIMVPLNTVLKTGDLVEIKTSKTSQGPSEGWLDFVVSATAKTQIKRFISKKNAAAQRDEQIEKGKTALKACFEERGYTEEESKKYFDDNQKKILEHFEMATLDDLYIGIYKRKPTANAVLDFINVRKKASLIKLKLNKAGSSNEVPVYCKGVGKIAITLGNCCTPIPGDDIVGYITRGKGITVHRKNCPNVAKEKERLVEVFWMENIEYANYPVDVQMEASDRNNLLTDILNTLAAQKVGVSAIHARYVGVGKVTVTATLLVSDAKRLQDIFNILLNITSIYEVERVIH